MRARRAPLSYPQLPIVPDSAIQPAISSRFAEKPLLYLLALAQPCAKPSRRARSLLLLRPCTAHRGGVTNRSSRPRTRAAPWKTRNTSDFARKEPRTYA
jgi:hypothetical protein